MSLLLQACTNPADVINDAIKTLQSESANWRTVLEQTRDKLIQQGQSTLANEVQNLLSQTLADVGVEVKCYTDFLRDRVREDLIRLRAKLTKETLTLIPVFCSPTPPIIDMNLSPERRPSITISGYNLDAAKIQVLLLSRGGQQSDVTFALANPTRYLLTLNLGSNGVPLSAASDKIIFKLPSGDNTISIVQPAQAGPTLRNAVASFHTNDDDKDSDTILSIYMYCPAGVVVGKVEGITGVPHDQSNSPPFALRITGAPHKEQLGDCTSEVLIQPNGHDTWKFDYSLAMTFSDGQTIIRKFTGQKLTENRTSLTVSLR